MEIIMENSSLKRFKKYKDLCNIHTNVELKEAGYPKSIQYLGGVLSGKYSFNQEEESLCYKACNVARAKKLMNKGDKVEKKNDAVTSQQEKN